MVLLLHSFFVFDILPFYFVLSFSVHQIIIELYCHVLETFNLRNCQNPAVHLNTKACLMQHMMIHVTKNEFFLVSTLSHNTNLKKFLFKFWSDHSNWFCMPLGNWQLLPTIIYFLLALTRCKMVNGQFHINNMSHNLKSWPVSPNIHLPIFLRTA